MIPSRVVVASRTSAAITRMSSAASSEAGSAGDIRLRLLDGALRHTKTHGWTHASLVQAAKDMQLSPSVTGLLKR